jgi:hypothetical protein
MSLFSYESGLILFVADLFHPVDSLAVQLFLNGDVGHRRGCRGSMPVFLTGRNPDDVTRRISSLGPAQRCARPQPAVTIKLSRLVQEALQRQSAGLKSSLP